MMLRYSLDEVAAADSIEKAVAQVITDGYRCADIANDAANETLVGTTQMGDAVVAALQST